MVEARLVEILRDDSKLLSVTESEGGIRYARCAYEVDILTGDGIDAERLEDEPARHRSRVVVARDSGAAIREGLLQQELNDVRRLIGAAGVVVEDRHEEAGFVGDVKVTTAEDEVQPVIEEFVATGHLDEAAHVLWCVERIGPDIAFIHEVRPSASHCQVGVGPRTIRLPRAKKALEAEDSHVLIPEVLEVVRSEERR